MSDKVKSLLEIMFYTGTVNSRQKMIAQQMYADLAERERCGELKQKEIPKLTTISN